MSQYAVHSLFSTTTSMPGLAALNASTASWVSRSRESLPQVDTRSVTEPSADPWFPLPGAQAAASRQARATTGASSSRQG